MTVLDWISSKLILWLNALWVTRGRLNFVPRGINVLTFPFVWILFAKANTRARACHTRVDVALLTCTHGPGVSAERTFRVVRPVKSHWIKFWNVIIRIAPYVKFPRDLDRWSLCHSNLYSFLNRLSPKFSTYATRWFLKTSRDIFLWGVFKSQTFRFLHVEVLDSALPGWSLAGISVFPDCWISKALVIIFATDLFLSNR